MQTLWQFMRFVSLLAHFVTLGLSMKQNSVKHTLGSPYHIRQHNTPNDTLFILLVYE